jgi:hypothetical protein
MQQEEQQANIHGLIRCGADTVGVCLYVSSVVGGLVSVNRVITCNRGLLVGQSASCSRRSSRPTYTDSYGAALRLLGCVCDSRVIFTQQGPPPKNRAWGGCVQLGCWHGEWCAGVAQGEGSCLQGRCMVYQLHAKGWNAHNMHCHQHTQVSCMLALWQLNQRFTIP